MEMKTFFNSGIIPISVNKLIKGTTIKNYVRRTCYIITACSAKQNINQIQIFETNY